jgi:hypothetical protein
MTEPYFDGFTQWTRSQNHVLAVKAKHSGLIFGRQFRDICASERPWQIRNGGGSVQRKRQATAPSWFLKLLSTSMRCPLRSPISIVVDVIFGRPTRPGCFMPRNPPDILTGGGFLNMFELSFFFALPLRTGPHNCRHLLPTRNLRCCSSDSPRSFS